MMRRTPMKRTGFKTVTELRGAVSQILTDERNARLFKFLAARSSTTPETELEREQRLMDKARRAMNSVVPRAATMGLGTTAAAPIPKAAPVRSEAYRRAVATLPCAICGVPGYSQAAHANTGKGMGMKACDLTCFPACGPRPGEQGCHAKLDQGALFTKAVRRELEPVWAADTQRRLLAMGLVPASLIDSISTALQGAPN
jgi:hypothetical protein